MTIPPQLLFVLFAFETLLVDGTQTLKNLLYAHSIPTIAMYEIDEFGCFILPKHELDLGTDNASYRMLRYIVRR